MKFLMMILLALITSAHAQETLKPNAEGLPLPWPFPWAKECPVEWSSLDGRYLLSDSANHEQISLKISVITLHGFRLLSMGRYSSTGELIADGFNFVSRNQRMLNVIMEPRSHSDKPITATLRLHYSDWSLGCAADHLVPILTLKREDSEVEQISHYRLVRVEPGKD